MRIISGRLKGRTFDSPRGHRTHPMSDKMRGALFSVLGDVDGLTVLDAFAGSGALGFEAVSRGCTTALLLDNDRSAQQTIAQNIKTLGLASQIKVVKASANAWLSTNQERVFDLVLCDPPYDDVQLPVILRLVRAVKPGGLLVLSWPGSARLPELDGAELLTSRRYGDSQLGFFRV